MQNTGEMSFGKKLKYKCKIHYMELTLLLSEIFRKVAVATQAKELANKNIITYFHLFNVSSSDWFLEFKMEHVYRNFGFISVFIKRKQILLKKTKQ